MQSISKQAIQAFSLIELMVVIAIIAGLTVLSASAYRDYYVRSTIAALLPLADGAKADVEDAHNQGTIFGTSGTQVYVSSSDTDRPTGLLSLIRVSYGCIDINIDTSTLYLGSGTITMTLCPSSSGNNYTTWLCGYESDTTSSNVTYLPADCQQTVASIQDTSF